MKEKHFTVDRPYMIIGSGEKMTILGLSDLEIREDVSMIVLGGPPRPQAPTQYIWRPLITGKINIYDAGENLEEIQVKNEDGTFFFQYDGNSNTLCRLFEGEPVKEINVLDGGDRLLLIGNRWYFNDFNKEHLIGEKVAENLYIASLGKATMEDSIIIGEYFIFGQKDVKTSYHKKGNKFGGGNYKDYIKNDDGYLLFRRVNLSYVIYKDDGKRCEEQEITTNILGLPVVFTYNDRTKEYLLSNFGGVTEIINIETPKETSHYIYSSKGLKIVVKDIHSKEHIFYYEKFYGENSLKTVDEAINERDNLGGKAPIYQLYGNWYNSEGANLGIKAMDFVFLKKDTFEEDSKITIHIFYRDNMLCFEKPKACSFGKDEDDNEFVLIVKQDNTAEIYILEGGKLKKSQKKEKKLMLENNSIIKKLHPKPKCFKLTKNGYVEEK